jgi:hypothetical protein
MTSSINNTYSSAFFIVPSYILDLQGLTLGFLRVYEAIFQFWNHNKACFLAEKGLIEKSGLKRTQVYEALSFFERHGEIKRVRKGTKRFLIRPEKIIETDCTENIPKSAIPDACTEISQTSGAADYNVRRSGRTTSGGADYNTKKLTKEIKELTNCKKPSSETQKPSSSFIFSESTDKNLLEQMVERDLRTPEQFLGICLKHVNKYSDPSHPRLKRANALVKLLRNLKADNVIFTVDSDDADNVEAANESSTKTETEQERNLRYLIENALERMRINRSMEGDVDFLKQHGVDLSVTQSRRTGQVARIS